MEYSEIKKTGIKIPALIFGTSALGNLYRAIDKDTKRSIVRECLRSVDGPVVFDSAGKYGAGLALEELGIALNELNADPAKVVISNKLGWLRTDLISEEPTFEKGVWMDISHDARQEISAGGIMRCLEQGNYLLGDKYQPSMLSVHDPDEYLAMAGNDNTLRLKYYNDILDAYKALINLKRSDGKPAIGIGAKEWKVIRSISEYIDLDWVMFANSLTIYSHPKELVEFISELNSRGITIINSAVFNAGFLTGGNYFNYQLLDINNSEHKKIFIWRDSFFRICRQFSVNPSHACIRFGLSHPSVCSIALNTSNPAHVARNAEEVQNAVPAGLFRAMKAERLIDNDYPYV